MVYLVCKNSTAANCPVRAILKPNHEAEVSNVHNHSPDKRAVDINIFKQILSRICKNDPTLPPLKCYIQAKNESKGKVTRRHIPLISYFLSMIYRNQKQSIPLIPKTIAQFEQLINDPSNFKRYAYDDVGSILYRGVWAGDTGKNIAFVSERTLQKVAKKEDVTLLMDGTYRSVPRHLKGLHQLYIINVLVRDRCFPLAYVLMERKDYRSYVKVFTELKKLVPSMKVVKCVTDYECATRKAILEQFPGVRLTGCYFHYIQALMKKGRRMGLLKDEELKSAINKIGALALLPQNYVMEGFNSISKNVKNSKRWIEFRKYWLFQWKNANISVYGLKHRSNNFSETLNRTINKLIGTKGPNIWKLILNLQSLEMIKSDELEQVAGLPPIRQSKKTILFNKKVETATKQFEKTEDVMEFLDYITFTEDFTTMYNVQEDPDDHNDSECPIIPNVYDEKTLFRKNHPRAAVSNRKRTSEISGACDSKKRKNK